MLGGEIIGIPIGIPIGAPPKINPPFSYSQQEVHALHEAAHRQDQQLRAQAARIDELEHEVAHMQMRMQVQQLQQLPQLRGQGILGEDDNPFRDLQ